MTTVKQAQVQNNLPIIKVYAKTILSLAEEYEYSYRSEFRNEEQLNNIIYKMYDFADKLKELTE